MRPTWTPPIQRDQLTVERIMLEVSRVLQSHEDFRLDDTFSLWVQHAAIPGGTCSTIESNQNVLLLRKLREKRCVTVVKNDDEICLARALVIGKALADNDKKLYATLRKQKYPTHYTDRTEQTKRAMSLFGEAGLTVRRFTLADVESFERVLSEYMIVIVGVEQLNSIIHAGAYKEKKILLLLHSEHFDVLTSLPAWFEHNMYCFHCLKCYDRRESHRCQHTCKQCLKQDCPSLSSEQLSIHCDTCNRDFKGNECFSAHKTMSKVQDPRLQSRSLCQKVFICTDCSRFVSTLNRPKTDLHRCGEVYCPVYCVHSMPGEHTCFMKVQKLTVEELANHQGARFLYFDVETYKSVEGVFVPNVAVLIDDVGNVTVFPSDRTDISGDVVDDVCNFIFQSRHRGYFVLAHNFRGFDGYFILKWLTKNGIVPDVIMDGSKILRLDVKEFNIKFRDTLSYVPLSLSKWATAFQVDQAKGSFPHSINAPEYWNQTIAYPDRKKYEYETMSKKQRKFFIKNYRRDRRKKKNKFNVNAELIDYCIQDVRTLRACAESLRQQFQQLSGGLCIFSCALTIAGVCGFFWRTRILKEGEVELVHRPSKRSSSVKARQWLKHMTEQDDLLDMETEAQIGSFFVDGLDSCSKTVYEFYGKWSVL